MEMTPNAVQIILDPHVQTAIGCVVVALIIIVGVLFAFYVDKISEDEKNGKE